MFSPVRTQLVAVGVLMAIFVAAFVARRTLGTCDSQANARRASPLVVEPCLEPDAAQKALLERISEKDAAAHALLRGELTLSQAAERFRTVSDNDAKNLMYLRHSYPGASDDELWHREVIGFTRVIRSIRALPVGRCNA